MAASDFIQTRQFLKRLPMDQFLDRWTCSKIDAVATLNLHTIRIRSMILAACYCKDLNLQYDVDFSCSLH